MIKSMTGYGRYEHKEKNISCLIEMKSVNHRYMDISIKIPSRFGEIQDHIKKKLKSSLSRGAFDIYVTLRDANNSSPKALKPNIELAAEYVTACTELKKHFSLAGDLDVNSIIQFKDIIKLEEKDVDTSRYLKVAAKAIDKTIASLAAMRETEGKALLADMKNRLKAIKAFKKNISLLQPKAVLDHKQRLKERVSDLLDKRELDERRLAEEIALLADRCDISEEMTRLDNHLEQFLKITKENTPVGRKLEFVVQEMNREVNTIGSKANDYKIAEAVIGIKSELEKIREQVQNIE